MTQTSVAEADVATVRLGNLTVHGPFTPETNWPTNWRDELVNSSTNWTIALFPMSLFTLNLSMNCNLSPNSFRNQKNGFCGRIHTKLFALKTRVPKSHPWTQDVFGKSVVRSKLHNPNPRCLLTWCGQETRGGLQNSTWCILGLLKAFSHQWRWPLHDGIPTSHLLCWPMHIAFVQDWDHFPACCTKAINARWPKQSSKSWCEKGYQDQTWFLGSQLKALHGTKILDPLPDLFCLSGLEVHFLRLMRYSRTAPLVQWSVYWCFDWACVQCIYTGSQNRKSQPEVGDRFCADWV